LRVEAVAALEGAVDEMQRRYSLFHAAGVANLVRYNAQASPEQRLPRIWLFHDEFAVGRLGARGWGLGAGRRGDAGTRGLGDTGTRELTTGVVTEFLLQPGTSI
jgi:hypothetical protein